MLDDRFDELLRARDRLAARLHERPSPLGAIAAGDREAQRARLSARLEAAIRGKERAMRRYDEEIRDYSELVARLDAAIEGEPRPSAAETRAYGGQDQAAVGDKGEPPARTQGEPAPRKGASRKRGEKGHE